MERIGNYTVIDKLEQTRFSATYRARKDGTPDSVILKEYKIRLSSASHIARFKREYETIRNIYMDGVVKILDIIERKDMFVLVLEDFDGVSIKSILEEKKNFDIKTFLNYAVASARILGDLHQNKIIHLAITPYNILVKEKIGTIKITNFGV